jgi:hypothetical protein
MANHARQKGENKLSRTGQFEGVYNCLICFRASRSLNEGNHVKKKAAQILQETFYPTDERGKERRQFRKTSAFPWASEWSPIRGKQQISINTAVFP